jgi:Fe-S-cluster containining protein
MFKNILETKELFFNNCDTCQSNCCSTGRISLAPLVINDFKEVYPHFPILFGEIDGNLKALMMINDGQSDCRYLSNGKCTIYDDRPPACKMYPISPYFDQIYIDVDCHAVGVVGDAIVKDGQINSNFYHNRIIDFPTKLAFTHAFLSTINNSLEFVLQIKNTDIKLYKYVGIINNEHIQMHKKSLKKLEL